MPTRTIEYTEEVTKEEEIVVCSDCGREIDENGKQFEDGGVELDFCSECLRKYVEDIHTDEFIERVEDWYEREDEAGDTMLQNIRTIRMTSAISLIPLLGIGLAVFVQPSMNLLLMFSFSLLIISVTLNIICSLLLDKTEWLRER